MAACGHIENVTLKVNGHRNPCNITFPSKCGIEGPFLASFLYFDESKYQNSIWPPSTNSIFFCFEPYNPYYLRISREKLLFSNMCLSPGIISCILTCPNIKIQDGHQRSYWKINSKENSPGNSYNTTFPINHCTQSPFLASFVYFDRSECQNSRWSPSVISIVFRFKPFDPLFLLNVTSETRFKQYLLILHIFPQWSPRKVEINNYFK